MRRIDWTSREIAVRAGVEHDTVIRWIGNGWLKAQMSNGLWRLPLTELMVANFLKDGQAPEQARESMRQQVIGRRDRPDLKEKL